MPPRFPPDVAVLSLRKRKYVKARQTIIDVATTLFETKGYSNTTLKNIADAAETSIATIMRYFAHKDAILLDKERTIVSMLRERVRARTYPTLSHGVRDIAGRSDIDLPERERLYQIILADPECASLLAALRREWEGPLEELYLQFSPDTWEGRLRAKSLAMMQVAIGMAGSQFWHDESPTSRPYPMQWDLIDAFIATLVKPIETSYAAQLKGKLKTRLALTGQRPRKRRTRLSRQ